MATEHPEQREFSEPDGAATGNVLQLYVRAGKNGASYGACPFSQQCFMALYLKFSCPANAIRFVVHTINSNKPIPEFRALSSKVPTLVHGREVLKHPDDIIEYLDQSFQEPDLKYANREAEAVCAEFFSKFSFFIRDVSHSPNPLLHELGRVNSYLEESGNRFLCGDTLCHLDCLVLPKLQHVRVAAKAFKDMELSKDLTALWRYFGNVYQEPAFKTTCPSDQEIVYFWLDKPQTPRLEKDKLALYSVDQEPKYTLDSLGGAAAS